MTAWITLYIAVLPPMPRATEPIAMAANARAWPRLRTPKRRSRANCPIHANTPMDTPIMVQTIRKAVRLGVGGLQGRRGWRAPSGWGRIKDMSDQQTWCNPVRARLQAGQPAFGVTITTASVEAAAHAATLGFHFLWIEMEHSPITLETLRLMVLATRGRPAAVFARVPVVELWTAKRMLDQGVSGVIFPFAGTAEKAARAAAACRYPPAGLRGSGAGAAVRTWPVPGNYYDSADQQVMRSEERRVGKECRSRWSP